MYCCGITLAMSVDVKHSKMRTIVLRASFAVLVLIAVSGLASGLASAEAQAGIDNVTFACYHSAIDLETSSGTWGQICHDQVREISICYGTCSGGMKDVPDLGYTFSVWSTDGNAQVSSSTANPTTLTTWCASGVCTGTVVADLK
jgi:hypothetical protein